MAVFSLQGAASAPGGLRGRLLQVVTEATDGLGFEPRLQFDGPIETIDVHIADHLMPVLREALSNIAHHAHAGHVRVAVRVADDVTLTVSDDGVGVPAEVLGRSRAHQHGRTGPRPRRRLHRQPPTLGRFPAHLAGAGPTVTTAGMTEATGSRMRDVRCPLTLTSGGAQVTAIGRHAYRHGRGRSESLLAGAQPCIRSSGWPSVASGIL